jgi:hypothetical protein
MSLQDAVRWGQDTRKQLPQKGAFSSSIAPPVATAELRQ